MLDARYLRALANALEAPSDDGHHVGPTDADVCALALRALARSTEIAVETPDISNEVPERMRALIEEAFSHQQYAPGDAGVLIQYAAGMHHMARLARSQAQTIRETIALPADTRAVLADISRELDAVEATKPTL